MDKTPETRTRNKRQEAARKGREKYMYKLKETFSNDTAKGGSRTSSSTTSASNAIIRSSDTYIYGVGIVAVLTIGGCVLSAYNKKSYQPMNKEQTKELVEHLVQPIKLPKQHSML